MMTIDMGCTECRGTHVDERIMRIVETINNQVRIFDGVPVHVCRQCGVRYFAPDVSQALSQAWTAKPDTQELVDVIRFDGLRKNDGSLQASPDPVATKATLLQAILSRTTKQGTDNGIPGFWLCPSHRRIKSSMKKGRTGSCQKSWIMNRPLCARSAMPRPNRIMMREPIAPGSCV